MKSWSTSQVVFSFGAYYDIGYNWVLDNGDAYSVYLEGATYSGSVSDCKPQGQLAEVTMTPPPPGPR